MVEKSKNSWDKELFELLESFALAIVFVVLIFTFIFRVFVVNGPSMNDTLLDGDKIMVSNLFFTPKTGDIVVFSGQYKDGEILVKRVIATEGQTVDISEAGEVILDGKVLKEPYLSNNVVTVAHDFSLPYTVKEGEVFVMGDNRTISLDSRDNRVGVADTRKILGKVIFRIFPNTGVISSN